MTEQMLPRNSGVEQEAKTVKSTVSNKGAARVSWKVVATTAEAGTQVTRLEPTQSARGKYSKKPGSSEDFASRKQEEIELEERRR